LQNYAIFFVAQLVPHLRDGFEKGNEQGNEQTRRTPRR
jgi:hypothetical protein